MGGPMAPMKFRAKIQIDFEGEDFVTAADHQRKIERAFQQIKAEYPAASLDLHQVRFGAGEGTPRRNRGRRYAFGALARYEDD